MKKLLVLLLCLGSVVSVFAGCGKHSNEIVLPKQVVEETLENRQQAMIASAWAYYDKNPYVQYGNDSLSVGGATCVNRGAEWMNNTPEMASAQRSVFLVCSRYCYASTYHAFDLPLLDSWARSSAIILAYAKDADLRPYVVWHYESKGNAAEDLVAMEEFFATMQPGDIFSYERRGDPVGHAGIWLDDVDGDGIEDLLNVGGGNYNRETGEDTREANGAVFYNANSKVPYKNGRDFFANPKAYDYFPKLTQVAILRPAAMEHAEQYPITERAKTRMLFPRLAATLEGEKGIYDSVVKGGEYTFTLTLENNSRQDHRDILVQLPVPTNAKIIRVGDTAVKNKTLKINVNIPAGDKIAIPYTVKATGEVGSLIETGVGYVHAIPLPSLNVAITSASVDAEAVKAAIDAGSGKSGDEFLASYLKQMGMEGAIPTVPEVQEALYAQKKVGTEKVLQKIEMAELAPEYQTLGKMAIAEFYGGTAVLSPGDSLRAKEVRAEDLQAGDILLWQKDLFTDPVVAIHDGEKLVMGNAGGNLDVSQWRLDELYIYRWFAAFRPTQGI